jgi:ribosomal protein L15
VKVLGAGELAVPLQVHADRFSTSAREKLEASGGAALTP